MLKKDANELDKLLLNRDPKESGLKNYLKWKKQYKYELLDYNYVHTLEEFSLMSSGGLLRPISVFTEEINSGGVIIKIEKDDKNNWYALLGIFIKNQKPKYWRSYFDKNYYFYKPPDKLKIDDVNTETMKCLMEKFVSKEEAEKYENTVKKFDIVDDLVKKYKKN